jgi:hypothetical protein
VRTKSTADAHTASPRHRRRVASISACWFFVPTATPATMHPTSDPTEPEQRAGRAPTSDVRDAKGQVRETSSLRRRRVAHWNASLSPDSTLAARSASGHIQYIDNIQRGGEVSELHIAWCFLVYFYMVYMDCIRCSTVHDCWLYRLYLPYISVSRARPPQTRRTRPDRGRGTEHLTRQPSQTRRSPVAERERGRRAHPRRHQVLLNRGHSLLA